MRGKREGPDGHKVYSLVELLGHNHLRDDV